MHLRSFFLFVFVQIFVDVILNQDRDHGVGGNSEIISGKTNPQIQEPFMLNSFCEAVKHVFVGKGAVSI